MSSSQNGWPVVTSASIASFPVPGTDIKLPIRRGDVATVLLYVAEQFDKTVERLHKGWCWGYAPRNVRGSATIISNHASGTAVDFNAPKHPLGVRGTFGSAALRAIQKILDFCGGVVRWGGNYTGRKDSMHFEINAGSARVTALAKKIRKAREVARPTTSISHTLLPKSSYHGQVMLLQRTLDKLPGISLTVDGDFGSRTTAAVRKFKADSKVHALHDDRNNPAVGPLTCKALGIKWTG